MEHFHLRGNLLPNTKAQPSDCRLLGDRAEAGTETWWDFTLSCAGDTAMTLDIQKFGFSQMLTTMRSTGGWVEPQGPNNKAENGSHTPQCAGKHCPVGRMLHGLCWYIGPPIPVADSRC